MRRITWDGKQVRLQWEREVEGGHSERYDYRSEAPVHPDFDEALQALVGNVIEALSLCGSVEVGESERAEVMESVTMVGVTFKDVEAGGGLVDGVTLTATRRLWWSDAPQIVVVPHVSVDRLPGGGGRSRVTLLVQEAAAYLRGKRAQGELFGETAGGDGHEVVSEASA